jgi:hypothetical protein
VQNAAYVFKKYKVILQKSANGNSLAYAALKNNPQATVMVLVGCFLCRKFMKK